MKRVIFFIFAVGFGLQWGCAGTKKQIESQSIEAVATPNATPNLELTPQEGQIPTTEHYTVIPYDCLWKIAGKVYQDAFCWPLIFKANRDQIKDPHWIYPKQVFKIERGQDEATVALAHLSAKQYHEKKRVKVSK